ncbi:MAG: glycosyltransferase family 9 protein [Planctomycetota bacterium]
MKAWPVPSRLVVWLPRSLGDAVQATAALAALRDALPATHIVWAGHRAAHEALAGLPSRDGVVPLDGPPRRGPGAVRSAARMLRAVRADAVVLLDDATGPALAARAAGIGRRIGTAPSAMRRRVVNDVVVVPTEGERVLPRPREEHFFDVVRPLGVSATAAYRPRVVVEAFDAERAARRLEACPAPGAGGLLLVAPGASSLATARMPASRLADAIRAVRAEHGVVPVVAPGPGEGAEGAALGAATGAPCLDLSSAPPDVGELKGLIARARLVVAADAGPRHLAQALGVPAVVFAGPTDPRLGRHEGVTWVRREDLGCLGCQAAPCPLEHHGCLEGLDPRQLADAIGAALSGTLPAARTTDEGTGPDLRLDSGA